jgi:transcriptional regulator
MRCVEPRKIIELLRLGEEGYSQREIAYSVNGSKTTVAMLQKRLAALGIRCQTAKMMTDDSLRHLVYPDRNGGRRWTIPTTAF